MKVSVVIPCYNEQDYLDRCLRAIFDQDEPADEVILVDNNSTDKSMIIAQKYPVRVIKEKIQGISHSRNAGFNAAKHEIIARADADVAVAQNWLKRIKLDFSQNNIDAIAGTVDFPNSFGKFGTNLFLDLAKITQGGKETIFGLNMAMSRKIWQKVRPYVIMDNARVHEDMDLALWIWAVGGKIIYDKNLVVTSSSRRILGNPGSFFLEYPARAIRTIRLPRHLSSPSADLIRS